MMLPKNFKTIAEVFEFLDSQKELSQVSSFLREAIEQEAKDLCTINTDSLDQNTKDTQEQFVKEINLFLNNPKSLDPNIIMNYRRRSKTWAVAEVIRKKGA